MRKIRTVIRDEMQEVQQEVKNKTVGYIVTALGLVAGLAWNDAVKTLIEEFFPVKENTILAKFFYAAVLTAVVALISAYLVKIFKKEEKKIEDKVVKKAKDKLAE